MAHGFTGKILHVDLTEGRHWVEEPDDAFYRKMMGGRALVAHYLLTLVPPGADPLGPENIFVMAPGIVTGSTFSGQGRNGVGAKSPLTGGLGSAEAGGYAGAELKRAGYDAVVVRGKAAKPSTSGSRTATSRSATARRVWGLDIADAEKKIREEVGDRGARTTLIGPGGENLVRFACVVNDISHFAGRTGVGAVMGSKNLKGIAIKAEGRPPGQRQEAEPRPRQVDDREPRPDLALPRRRHGRRPARPQHGRRPADLQLPGRLLRGQREDHRHHHARHDPDQAGHVLRLRRALQAGRPGRGHRARHHGRPDLRRPRVREPLGAGQQLRHRRPDRAGQGERAHAPRSASTASRPAWSSPGRWRRSRRAS